MAAFAASLDEFDALYRDLALEASLIAGFYEAAAGRRTWPDVLDRFTKATSAFVCQLVDADKIRGQVALCAEKP
jgi:hypothetical protein